MAACAQKRSLDERRYVQRRLRVTSHGDVLNSPSAMIKKKNKEIIMRMLSRLVICAIVIPVAASADKVKEVVISGQTAPIDVQVMTDVPVNVVTLPTPPARARGFELEIGNHDLSDEYTVGRDSILKFVNVNIDFHRIVSRTSSLQSCTLEVAVRFPPPDDKARLKLAKIVSNDADGGELGDFVPTPNSPGSQFLTGDILLPAGSVLTFEKLHFLGVLCSGSAYGILFEVE
jgi:hypothetical protein